MKDICNFISRYVGVIVLLVAVVALLLPESFRWIDTVCINPLLGLVMFGMGLTLNPNDFKVVFSRPKDVIIGCLAQFIVMPGLAFGKGIPPAARTGHRCHTGGMLSRRHSLQCHDLSCQG